MLDFLIPVGIVLLGTLGLTIYVLTVALRDAVRQITSMNEKLLILRGVQEGGSEVGRALVAASRPPKKEIPGVAASATKDEGKDKKGYTITVGAR